MHRRSAFDFGRSARASSGTFPKSLRPTAEWQRVVVLGAALLGVYVLLGAVSTLWDRDEPRFARAAVEMLSSGDFSVITFNGDLRAVKPPLVYWLMTVGLKIFGFTELAFRVWSAIGMTIAAVGVYGFGRRMLGQGSAEWAMVIFGTSVMPLWLASAATADGVLIACMVVPQWLFIEMVYRGVRWWDFPLLALSLGLTALAKGPMAALPVFSIALSIFFLTRAGIRPPHLGGRFWVGFIGATVAGMAIFLAWAVPANNATGGELAQQGLWGRGFLSRMVRPMQGHGGEGVLGYFLWLPFYIPALIFITFPWCLLLPGTISSLVRGHLLGVRERSLIWAWILPTFVTFSLVATKLPHYMLGLMPMLAVAMAGVLRRYRARTGKTERNDAVVARASRCFSEKDRDWIRGGAFFYAAIGGGIAAALIVGPWFARLRGEMDAGLVLAGALCGSVVTGGTLVVVRRQLAERVRSAAFTALGVHVAVVLLGALVLIPQIERAFKISHELAEIVRDRVPKDTPVHVWGYEEPSLVFYLNLPYDQPVEELRGGRDAILEYSRASGPGALVISRERWLDVMGDEEMPVGLENAATRRTVNYSSHARETEVWVLIRR